MRETVSLQDELQTSLRDHVQKWVNKYKNIDPELVTVEINWNTGSGSNPHLNALLNMTGDLATWISNTTSSDMIDTTGLFNDPVWSAKLQFAYQILLEYNFTMIRWRAPGIKRDLDNWDFVEKTIIPELVNKGLYVHFHWSDSKLHGIDAWQQIFYEASIGESIHEDETIEDNLFQLEDQLLAFYFLYWKILPQCKRLSLALLFRLDHSFTQLTCYWTAHQVRYLTNSIPHTKRTEKSNLSPEVLKRISDSQKYCQIIREIYESKKDDPIFSKLKYPAQRAQRIKQTAKSILPIGIRQIKNLMKKEGLN